MVTHRNLMHNRAHDRRGLRALTAHGVGVCWLPPYHDMGLIGGMLQLVFHGRPTRC